MLIICPCCGRRRTLEKRKRGLLRCTNCGAQAARVIRKIKVDIPTLPGGGYNLHYRQFYYPNPVPIGPGVGAGSR